MGSLTTPYISLNDDSLGVLHYVVSGFPRLAAFSVCGQNRQNQVKDLLHYADDSPYIYDEQLAGRRRGILWWKIVPSRRSIAAAQRRSATVLNDLLAL